MPLVGFEPMIPVFKRTKTFHASDRAATVTSRSSLLQDMALSRLVYFLHNILYFSITVYISYYLCDESYVFFIMSDYSYVFILSNV
jgi:hypothetical protein